MAKDITRWDQIIGSQGQIKIILNAIKRGVLPHFVLYTGGPGIGKSTIAKLTAKSLLCENPNEDTGLPCYCCKSCLSIDNGTNISYKKINMPEISRKEDVNEQIKDIFRFQKLSARTVYVLEEIHDLRPEFQRPLLEPLTDIPDDVYILSCTTAPYKLITELAHRAFKLELVNPKPQECYRYVATVAADFGIALPNDETIEKYAELCDYNPRIISDTIRVVATDNTLTEESLIAMFNSVKDADICKFLQDFSTSTSVVDLITTVKDLEGCSLNRLVSKSIDVTFSALLYKHTLVEPDIKSTKLRELITGSLFSLSVETLAQIMTILGSLDLKDRESFSKNLSKIIEGKLKFMRVVEKSLIGISKATTPVKPPKNAIAELNSGITQFEQGTTSEFNNSPIINSAQVMRLLVQDDEQ